MAVSDKAWEVIKKTKSYKFYFDLVDMRKGKRQASFTPAVSMIFALDESLRMLEEEGAEIHLNGI